MAGYFHSFFSFFFCMYFPKIKDSNVSVNKVELKLDLPVKLFVAQRPLESSRLFARVFKISTQ